jgi:hypothetical protein
MFRLHRIKFSACDVVVVDPCVPSQDTLRERGQSGFKTDQSGDHVDDKCCAPYGVACDRAAIGMEFRVPARVKERKAVMRNQQAGIPAAVVVSSVCKVIANSFHRSSGTRDSSVTNGGRAGSIARNLIPRTGLFDMPDFTCKFCGGAYEVPEENVGDSIDCPSCDREIVAGDVIGGSSESGTSAAARILEERHAGKKSRPGYTMPMTWVTPLLVGIVSGVVIHLLVAIVSLKIKPFPDIIVYWVPIVFGVSTGLGAFMQSARVGVSTVPVWVTLLGILVIVPGAYLPIDVLKDQYHRRARNKLAAAVNAVTRPPYLPATTPQCISVRIGEVTKVPERKVRAFLESDEVFDLTADVNLASGKLVGGITEMQRALGAKAAADALAAMLDRYEAFKDLRHERFELTRVKRAGRYLGEIVFPESVTFDLEVLVGSQVTCSLAAKSHIRASAMPHIERLWARYDPTFHGTCRDVELFKPIDARHLAAQATMADGKTVPIILEVSNVKDPKAEVRVLFRFREAAVMKINESLYELDAEGRRTSIERCVDVDHRKELRAGGVLSARAFPGKRCKADPCHRRRLRGRRSRATLSCSAPGKKKQPEGRVVAPRAPRLPTGQARGVPVDLCLRFRRHAPHA